MVSSSLFFASTGGLNEGQQCCQRFCPGPGLAWGLAVGQAGSIVANLHAVECLSLGLFSTSRSRRYLQLSHENPILIHKREGCDRLHRFRVNPIQHSASVGARRK